MIRLLKGNGFTAVNQNGSHLKMRNSKNITVIIPVHKRDLKKGVEQKILKDAGLKQPKQKEVK